MDARVVVVIIVIAIALTMMNNTAVSSPFSSIWIYGDRDRVPHSGVDVLPVDMSLTIRLAGKDVPACTACPLITHILPPHEAKASVLQ
jgi:hypothetical protein